MTRRPKIDPETSAAAPAYAAHDSLSLGESNDDDAEVREVREQARAPAKLRKRKEPEESDELASPAPQAASAPQGFGGGLERDTVAADLLERRQAAPLYRAADKTQEWAESDWWHVRSADAGPQLIAINRFWRDLARHDPARPFLSPQLGECTDSLAAALCALALLDLPFVAGAHAVVVTPSRVDDTAWAHVSQHGSTAEVLAYLARHNLGRVDLERIAWRMRDPDAFARVLALLDARHTYSDRLWAYALVHRERARVAEWLRHQDQWLRPAGPVLDDALVDLDPVERRWYEHLEYAPLINARAHQLGERRQILNDALAAQYRGFLDQLAHRASPGPDDLLAAASSPSSPCTAPRAPPPRRTPTAATSASTQPPCPPPTSRSTPATPAAPPSSRPPPPADHPRRQHAPNSTSNPLSASTRPGQAGASHFSCGTLAETRRTPSCPPPISPLLTCLLR